MTSPDSSTQSAKIRVLIVDDVPETCRNLRRMLYYESSVEVVGVASNGLEGIKLTEAHRPDIVLMDVKMPEMDGITACQQLKERGLHAAVIMMSVQGYPDHLRRSMMVGAKDFLVKPFSSDELLAAIRRVTRIGPVVRPITTVVQIPVRRKTRLFIISEQAATLGQMLAQARDLEVVGVASNGSDSLPALHTHTPDVVLIELKPSIDGLITAHQLTPPATPRQTLVLVPNQTEANYLLQSKFAADTTFLAHPFSTETLIQVIQSLRPPDEG